MMKNLLFAFVGMWFTIPAINAQSIPNAGFENWTSGSPDNWGTISAGTFGSTTSQTTDKNSGSSAALLETQTVPFVGNIPGLLISNGSINTSTYSISGGFQYTLQPATLSGFYKSTPSSGDSTAVLVWLTKWNGTSRDTIAFGSIALGTIGSYTQKDVTLTYIQSPPAPDTAMIFIASTKQIPPATVPAGGKIYVDDLAFTGGNVGFQEINPALFPQIFPNPASNHITLNVANTGNIFIYDISGKNIVTLRISNKITEISTMEFSEGIYFYQVKNENGENISTGKFNIVK